MPVMQLPDGRRVNYCDLGSGPAIILLHGWGMSSEIFSGIINDLAYSFRVLIPDLRGHGASAPGTGYALNDFSADLEAWFDQLNLNSCSLVGWSFGGQVAMHLILENRLPVERLILVSSTPKFCQSEEWLHGLPSGQVRAMQRQLVRNSRATLTDFYNLMFAGDGQLSKQNAEAGLHVVLPDDDAGIQSLATLITTDFRNRLSEITKSTLIHHGMSDRVIPASAGKFVAGEIHKAESVFWDEVGHAPFLTCPSESVLLWKEFLQ